MEAEQAIYRFIKGNACQILSSPNRQRLGWDEESVLGKHACVRQQPVRSLDV